MLCLLDLRAEGLGAATVSQRCAGTRLVLPVDEQCRVAVPLVDVGRIGLLVALAGEAANVLVVGPRAGVFVHVPRLRLELDDACDRAVEEGAVMRDQHDAGPQAVQEALEALEPGEVEIVRRLVEAEDVETGQQERGERGTGRLAPREPADLVAGASAQADLGERGRRPGVKSPPPSARKRSSASAWAPTSRARRPAARPARRARRRRADAGAPSEVGKHRLAGCASGSCGR